MTSQDGNELVKKIIDAFKRGEFDVIAALVQKALDEGVEAEGIAKNAHIDFTNPVEPYFAAEIAHAVTGMDRQEANQLVKALLEEYEQHLGDPPLGVRVQDCIDLESGEISSDFRKIYRSTRQEMIDKFGLDFKYPSMYL